jgi:hypothetical protein
MSMQAILNEEAARTSGFKLMPGQKLQVFPQGQLF